MDALRMHEVEIGQKWLLQIYLMQKIATRSCQMGSLDSDEDVHDFIVIDLEEVAYDNHDFEHMDTLSRDKII